MITEIKAFKTEDGAIFETREQAIAHEEEPKVRKWYDENQIKDIHFLDMLAWLVKNIEQLMIFAPFFKAKRVLDPPPSQPNFGNQT